MAAFIRLDDSPMFQNQICSLELTADELKDRCQSLYKGCKNFMTALGEACNGDTIFADSLEAFGGGTDDPVSVSVGGPVMSKFISAFHELATYKELLRSQVEHVLIDRLMHFMTVDLQEAKDSRRRFDKAIHAYDQARERFVSLKKNTREDIVAELQEDLENSKSAFEKSRFNLVNALMNIEAKKKYEFLESVSAIMDAHLRYFKLGYELLKQLEPYIHQVLTYAQQSKEQAKVEQDRLAKRIQEFRTQAEMDALRASSNIDPSAGVNVIRVFGMNSHKSVEAIMQSRANGEVQTIKQGYLLKRSSSLRGDWKRRFFLLNSQGSLYYYRVKGTKPMGSHPQHFTRPAEQNSGMFGRFRSKHNRGASLNEDILSCRTVDLRTSLIKMDAEDSDLRLCFRIISPLKTYTLQAENEADRMDWINKITGAITSLLNSQFFDQPSHITTNPETNKSTGGASHGVQTRNSHQDLGDDIKSNKIECVSSILRGVPGNDLCAECSAPEPDWASLNLGILLCIECSGVHRNLGVHISKVRSLRLDVKVWEPTILDLFRNLGNAYCNSIWEGLLLLEDVRADDSNALIASTSKPCPKDAIHLKEKYIQAKSQTSDHRKNQTATMSGTSSVGDKSLDSGSAKSSSKPVLLSNTHDNLSSHPITTHKLNGENYLQWSQSVMLFIRGRGKTGFLTGATQKPKEGLESIETWESENALIMSWLINSMEPTISKTYMFLATAQEIWEAAKETFSDLGNSAQYVEKLLVIRDESVTERPACSTSIWEAVKSNNLQEVYRLIVLSDMNIINTTFDNVFDVDLHHHVEAQESISGRSAIERKHFDPESCDRIKNSNEPGNCLQGCSLLHLACHSGNLQMIELLLQFGTDINLRDFHGRTPLHHCISSAKNPLAKFLLRRGARPSIKDGGGLSSLERAMEMGAITDEELFILLTECE